MKVINSVKAYIGEMDRVSRGCFLAALILSVALAVVAGPELGLLLTALLVLMLFTGALAVHAFDDGAHRRLAASSKRESEVE